jgi:hypothetical protein
MPIDLFSSEALALLVPWRVRVLMADKYTLQHALPNPISARPASFGSLARATVCRICGGKIPGGVEHIQFGWVNERLVEARTACPEDGWKMVTARVCATNCTPHTEPGVITPEDMGSTEADLKAFRKHMNKLGLVDRVEMACDPDAQEWFVTTFIGSRAKLVLHNLSAGYGGTGPHGFLEALLLVGMVPTSEREREVRNALFSRLPEGKVLITVTRENVTIAKVG